MTEKVAAFRKSHDHHESEHVWNIVRTEAEILPGAHNHRKQWYSNVLNSSDILGLIIG